MRLPTFFIAADSDSEGHSSAMNLDLFVVARDVHHALGFWRRYYALERSDQPDSVFVVGQRSRAGAIGWNTPPMRRVWRRIDQPKAVTA